MVREENGYSQKNFHGTLHVCRLILSIDKAIICGKSFTSWLKIAKTKFPPLKVLPYMVLAYY